MDGRRHRFAREDTIEEEWRIVEPILDHSDRPAPYYKGTWGPSGSDALTPTQPRRPPRNRHLYPTRRRRIRPRSYDIPPSTRLPVHVHPGTSLILAPTPRRGSQSARPNYPCATTRHECCQQSVSSYETSARGVTEPAKIYSPETSHVLRVTSAETSRTLRLLGRRNRRQRLSVDARAVPQTEPQSEGRRLDRCLRSLILRFGGILLRTDLAYGPSVPNRPVNLSELASASSRPLIFG
jgi:hypothetical protein